MKKYDTTFKELTKADKTRLAKLCEALNIPLYPEDNLKTVQDALDKDECFFGDPLVKHKNGLLFHTSGRVSELLHEIAHVLVLGNEHWSKLKDGANDFADVRWKAEEERPVMALQIMLAECLKNYGGKKQCFKDMEAFGYGFGDEYNGNPIKWYKDGLKGDLLFAKHLKQYKTFKREHLK